MLIWIQINNNKWLAFDAPDGIIPLNSRAYGIINKQGEKYNYIAENKRIYTDPREFTDFNSAEIAAEYFIKWGYTYKEIKTKSKIEINDPIPTEFPSNYYINSFFKEIINEA